VNGSPSFPIRSRSIFIGIAATGLMVMRFADPVIIGRWAPFRTSCGAITGLPCLFCGLTRALHLLLRGDFSGALYFNWLAFPFLAVVIFIVALFAVEIAIRRKLLNLHAIAPLTARRLTICAVVAVELWILHAYLAVSQHKTELLNPHGPLYHWFVRS
jgi:Protein of unknown function (DUF2752)